MLAVPAAQRARRAAAIRRSLHLSIVMKDPSKVSRYKHAPCAARAASIGEPHALAARAAPHRPPTSAGPDDAHVSPVRPIIRRVHPYCGQILLMDLGAAYIVEPAPARLGGVEARAGK